jgi:hypothetical protein
MLVHGLHMLNFAIRSSTGSDLGAILPDPATKGELAHRGEPPKERRLVDSLDKFVFANATKRPSTMQ